jgi:uncharacterized protein YrrD
MEFRENTSVYTSDGKDAGKLQRVVMDPETKEVTHIVILKGLIFREEKVVEVQKVASAAADTITLTCSMDELKEMAPLEVSPNGPGEEELEPRPDGEEPLAGGIYVNPATNVPGTNSAMNPAMNPAFNSNIVQEKTRTIPEELVALKEGARVFSADDRPVGTLKRVFTDSQTGSVTHFTLTYGLLVQTLKSIPVGWVKEISDDEIHLNVLAQKVTTLPDIQV